jgi:hypothetical protein
MSLLSAAYEPCTIINRAIVPDGQGGVETTWTDGATIQAAIVLDNSMQARIGAVEGVTAVYTITTERNINLQYHEVLRRESDGKIFRVTSDGDDKKTPKSAKLDMRQVSAEEWSIPA